MSVSINTVITPIFSRCFFLKWKCIVHLIYICPPWIHLFDTCNGTFCHLLRCCIFSILLVYGPVQHKLLGFFSLYCDFCCLFSVQCWWCKVSVQMVPRNWTIGLFGRCQRIKQLKANVLALTTVQFDHCVLFQSNKSVIIKLCLSNCLQAWCMKGRRKGVNCSLNKSCLEMSCYVMESISLNLSSSDSRYFCA